MRFTILFIMDNIKVTAIKILKPLNKLPLILVITDYTTSNH